MIIERKIKTALAAAGLSQSELAKRIGMTPSNLNQKIKRETLTYDEMCKIAKALDCEWIAEFRFEDGKRI